MAEQIITILNWDKYNPKRDQSTYTWLRLSNGIASDPDLHGLSAGQKFVFIALLCEASKKNSASIALDLSFLVRTLAVRRSSIEDLLEFLERKQIVSISRRPPVVAATTPTNERTNERDERTGAAAPAFSQSPQLSVEQRNEEQEAAESDWIATLRHFKIDRPVLTGERMTIAQYIKLRGIKEVRYALVGMRFEPGFDGFRPADHVSLKRAFDPDNMPKFINYAVKENSKQKARAS